MVTHCVAGHCYNNNNVIIIMITHCVAGHYYCNNYIIITMITHCVAGHYYYNNNIIITMTTHCVAGHYYCNNYIIITMITHCVAGPALHRKGAAPAAALRSYALPVCMCAAVMVVGRGGAGLMFRVLVLYSFVPTIS